MKPVSTGLHRQTHTEIDGRTGDVKGHFWWGKKSSLNHTPAWPDKFLFKTQRNEFEALGRKPLNAVQLISQDNSRHCMMFVWSLTHKATKLVLFLYIFLQKIWLNEKLLPYFAERKKRIQLFNFLSRTENYFKIRTTPSIIGRNEWRP